MAQASNRIIGSGMFRVYLRLRFPRRMLFTDLFAWDGWLGRFPRYLITPHLSLSLSKGVNECRRVREVVLYK